MPPPGRQPGLAGRSAVAGGVAVSGSLGLPTDSLIGSPASGTVAWWSVETTVGHRTIGTVFFHSNIGPVVRRVCGGGVGPQHVRQRGPHARGPRPAGRTRS
jgi:hypothetical protein